ncbi:ATP-binding response regulator [Hyphobacterium marinum]|uniref:histidine kinase n=1 Tax=Hyphobacterium marinum TaxID=3116574 RepID=A0ABU7LUX1_9PROT|nr:ATP-binding protein [Hyphobacterium sp. Y6023]MEE2565052.1 ATP-binding protein [Hyphobacterium sp. Y6023]
MTDAADSFARSQDPADLLAGDIEAVRLEQARLLVRRNRLSCLIVEGLVVYFTALILFAGDYAFAAIWFVFTSLLVGVVYAYPRLTVPDGITAENFRRFLQGHIAISTLTGLVWSGLAMAYLDPSSLLNLFITINMVVSITLGGMLPSAEYRPTFVGLASGMFLPFSIYWLVTVDGPARLIGVGLLIFYGFGLLVSARSEIQTVETLAAERNRRLAAALQAQNRIIEKASAEKSRFLAATSHDMSQPLQAQGFFLQALRRLLDRPEQTELLDKIEAAWRSQQTLLQALVESARLDSGAIVARRTAFDLEIVTAGLKSEFEATAARRGIALHVGSCPFIVDSDPLLVTRILRNLLSNALKFTPAGGTVELTAAVSDAGVLVAVSDTGPGIPAADQDRIFDDYVQLTRARNAPEPGLGLGLPIVRQLASKLGADFSFQSEPGAGTRAGIVLPLAEPGREPETVADIPDEISGAPLVILVEDEASIREGLEILLTCWGCRVIAAASGDTAMQLLSWADAEPSLIIADRRLADGEDGLDVVDRLRGEVLDDVPAILLSGDIVQHDAIARMPRVTLLPKPADSDQLRAALISALHGPGTG